MATAKHTVTTPDDVVLEKRIKQKDIPDVRRKLMARQAGACVICGRNLSSLKRTACVDHDHKSGFIRGVLCNNCNGIEGKLASLLSRIDVKRLGARAILAKMVKYWEKEPTEWIHPNAMTKNEQRLRRNKLARTRRAKLKDKK